MTGYFSGLITLALINAIAVTGLAVFTGFTGLMSLGHAAFLAVGAYAGAIATLRWGWPFYAALAFAALTAAALSLLIGVPTLRAELRSDYFTIATLGFGEAVRVLLENLELTNGARGLSGIPMKAGLLSVLAVFVVAALLCKNYVYSRFGRMGVAAREDALAARGCGVGLFWVRLRALMISAACAGASGCCTAHYIGVIQPNMFTNLQSTTLTATVVAGGMGSLSGPILAALLLTLLPELLRVAELWRMVGYGALLVGIVVLRPSGLLGYRELGLPGLFRAARARRGGYERAR